LISLFLSMIVIMLFSFPLVLGDEQYNIKLEFFDLSTNYQISDFVLNYNLDGDEYSTYVDDGLLELDLEKGKYDLELKVDDTKTLSIDYYLLYELVVKEDTTTKIYLTPVGSVRGFVKDSLDNIVPEADLKFDCPNHPKDLPVETDEFGFFKVDNIAVGNSDILASYGKAVGMVDVQVEKGEITEVTINLDKSLLQESPRNIYAFMGGFLIVLFILLLLYVYQRTVDKKQSQPKVNAKQKVNTKNDLDKDNNGKNNNDKNKVTDHINTILTTLNAKEKAVVEYLLANNNQTSQAKIRHNTGLPRTTLSRLLQGLEGKKIIFIEKHGKMVKVGLTDFFLDKQ